MRVMRGVLTSALSAAVLLVTTGGPVHGQVPNCTGNQVIDHAPYTCTDSRVIAGITFDIILNVDAVGQAVVDFVMTPAQPADVPIAVHSYTNINQNPQQVVTGSILAGQTTAQLVVPRIECGQLDIKAVDISPSSSAGRIAGPQVTWGDICQVVPTTTTTTTTAPTSVVPSSVSPASTAAPTSALPPTGAGGLVPWTWSLPVFGLAAVLVLVSRRRRPAPE